MRQDNERLRTEVRRHLDQVKNGMAAIDRRFLYWALVSTGLFVSTIVGAVMFIVRYIPS